MSPQAHCTKSEHSSELGSRMKSTIIWLQRNHSVVHGPRSHADSAEKNKELLSPEHLELSHITLTLRTGSQGGTPARRPRLGTQRAH